MKKPIGNLLLVLALLFSSHALEAQKLRDLLKKTSKDIENGVLDAIGEKISEKITEQAVKKINAELDSILFAEYKSDSIRNNSSASYTDFLAGFDESDKVGESYKFDLSTKMKDTDPKGNVTYSTYHYSKDGQTFGIESDETLVVFDANNKILVTYNIEEKSAFAFGTTMMRYGSQFVEDDLFPHFEIQASVGSKNILGYNCKKYLGKSNEASYEVYVSNEFTISLKDTYSAIGTAFFDNRWNDSFSTLDGVFLESSSTELNGDVSKSIVVDIVKTGFTLDNSQYKFGEQ